jgi:hypothetical protein
MTNIINKLPRSSSVFTSSKIIFLFVLTLTLGVFTNNLNVEAVAGFRINNVIPVVTENSIGVKLRTVIYACDNQMFLGSILPNSSIDLANDPVNLSLRSFVEVIPSSSLDDVLTLSSISQSFGERICNNQIESNEVVSYNFQEISNISVINIDGNINRVTEGDISQSTNIEIVNIPDASSIASVVEKDWMEVVSSSNQTPNFVIVPQYCVDGNVTNANSNGNFELTAGEYNFSEIIGGQEIATCSPNTIAVTISDNNLTQINFIKYPNQNQFLLSSVVSLQNDPLVINNDQNSSNQNGNPEENLNNETSNTFNQIQISQSNNTPSLLRTGGFVNKSSVFLGFYILVAIVAITLSIGLFEKTEKFQDTI